MFLTNLWLFSLPRLNLAEKLKAPWKRGGKRPDPAMAAAREATRMEQHQGGGSLGFTVKMMLIGLTGDDIDQISFFLYLLMCELCGLGV